MRHLSFRKGVATLGMTLALLGCASATQAKPENPLPSRDIMHIQKLPLVGKWEQGTCTFSENSLTYSKGENKKSLKLDMEAADPQGIVCSEDYTVILTPQYAVVALGAHAIFSGFEGFGYLGFVNSYGIEIHPDIPNEGITGGKITGDTLEVTTSKGKWEINIPDPKVWEFKGLGLPRL